MSVRKFGREFTLSLLHGGRCLVRGRGTYEVRSELRALGGDWNRELDPPAWEYPPGCAARVAMFLEAAAEDARGGARYGAYGGGYGGGFNGHFF